MRQIGRLILIGVSSSLVLGALLKTIQIITGKKVYVLLLNVDYFPILKDIQLSDFVEFLLHVLVSIILVFILYDGLKRINNQARVSYYVAINGCIGAFLYITTSFSERTPEFLDIPAFSYWVVAHLIYGATVGLFIRITEA